MNLETGRRGGVAFGLGLALVLCVAGCQSPDSQHTGGAATGGMPAGSRASSVVDLRNRPVDPFKAPQAKALVLIFVRTDCPIANRYAPEIERLYRRFAPRQVAWWLVYADAETRPEAIRRHLREYRLSLKTLRDPAHALVKRAGASVTPEAAVFLPDGREVYHGRIDDRCVDFGRERPAPTQHDLEEALNAVLDGKPVAQATTQAIGCYIPDLADGSARNPAQDEQSKSDAN